MRPRNIQVILDLMIASGYYEGDGFGYMCNSLRRAARNGIITPEEYHKTEASIESYLCAHHFCTMRAGLSDYYLRDLKHAVRRRAAAIGALEIYQNWSNRPRKSRGSFEAVMQRRAQGWVIQAIKELGDD